MKTSIRNATVAESKMDRVIEIQAELDTRSKIMEQLRVEYEKVCFDLMQERDRLIGHIGFDPRGYHRVKDKP